MTGGDRNETTRNGCACRPGCRQWVSVVKSQGSQGHVLVSGSKKCGIDWKGAVPELKIIGDAYDQIWWLHCDSWRPAHFRARFQLAARGSKGRLPEGGIGQLWSQTLGSHRSEQNCSLDPNPSNAYSSLALCTEPTNTFKRHNLQVYNSQFQIVSCMQNNYPGSLPNLPQSYFSWPHFLIPKIRFLYLPLVFLSTLRLFFSAASGPVFSHCLVKNSLLWPQAYRMFPPPPLWCPSSACHGSLAL